MSLCGSFVVFAALLLAGSCLGDEPSDFFTRKAKTYFASTDASGNGELNLEDYHLLATRHAEIANIEEDPEAWKAFKLDTSRGDTPLSLQQFLAAVWQKRNDPTFHATLKQSLTNLFGILDFDKSGQLQVNEFIAHLGARGVNSADATDSFNAIDDTHDGFLDLEKYLSTVLKFLTSDDEEDPSKYSFGPLSEE